MDVQKISKSHPFIFFGTMRLTGDFRKISKKNRKNFFSIFFPLFRHSATSFRQKKFPQKLRLHFFRGFAAAWMLKNTKRSPFQFFFGVVILFSIFFIKGSLQFFWIFGVLWKRILYKVFSSKAPQKSKKIEGGPFNEKKLKKVSFQEVRTSGL